MHGNRQNAGWLSEVQDENAAGEAQQEFLITVEKVQRACKNMSPWKATGLDGVQGYWIKGFTTLHGRVAHQLNDIVQHKKVSTWLNKEQRLYQKIQQKVTRRPTSALLHVYPSCGNC